VALAEVAQRQAGSPAGLDATIAWTSVG
jgi:hypothetical protein